MPSSDFVPLAAVAAAAREFRPFLSVPDASAPADAAPEAAE